MKDLDKLVEEFGGIIETGDSNDLRLMKGEVLFENLTQLKKFVEAFIRITPISDTREEFNKWHNETYGVKPSFNRDHDGSRYWDGDKNSRCEAWFACQELNDMKATKNSLDYHEKYNKLVDLLERAQNGLRWYQDLHPEHYSEADNELHNEIDEAIIQATKN